MSKGIKPLSASQLSGKRVVVSESKYKPNTNNIIVKDLTIIVPKTTNMFEVTVTKEAVEANKPIKFEIISQPSTHNLKISVDPIAKTETITTNFLVFWYGTIILIIVAYLAYKFFPKKSCKNKPEKIVDLTSNI